MTKWRDTIYHCIHKNDFMFSVWYPWNGHLNPLEEIVFQYGQSYDMTFGGRYYGVDDDADTVFSNRIIIW